MRVAGGRIFSVRALLACSQWILQKSGAHWLVASIGAIVVILIGIPHSSFSKPWPVIGGHTLSALAGVVCAKIISTPVLTAELRLGRLLRRNEGSLALVECFHANKKPARLRSNAH